MTRILLVEDDAAIVSTLTAFLESEGFSVCAVSGQQAALKRLKEGFDLMLLDVSLADGNGFALCHAVKERMALPVIFLTASIDEYSTVTGLDLGAEDYIGKPFRPRELISRIRAVLRRSGKSRDILQIGDIQVDLEKAAVTRDGKKLPLTALEYRLLLILLQHRGEVLSRDRILTELWDAAGEFVEDNTLTVYMKRLREKIERNPQQPELIRTVRGRGYCMEEET